MEWIQLKYTPKTTTFSMLMIVDNHYISNVDNNWEPYLPTIEKYMKMSVAGFWNNCTYKI